MPAKPNTFQLANQPLLDRSGHYHTLPEKDQLDGLGWRCAPVSQPASHRTLCTLTTSFDLPKRHYNYHAIQLHNTRNSYGWMVSSTPLPIPSFSLSPISRWNVGVDGDLTAGWEILHIWWTAHLVAKLKVGKLSISPSPYALGEPFDSPIYSIHTL